MAERLAVFTMRPNVAKQDVKSTNHNIPARGLPGNKNRLEYQLQEANEETKIGWSPGEEPVSQGYTYSE